MTDRTITKIQVLGRRWFSTTYGNTYHVADIWVTFSDGTESKLYADYAYGYDNQYLESALNELESAGLATVLQTQYGRETLRLWCTRNDVTLVYRALDVKRRKDLRAQSLVL